MDDIVLSYKIILNSNLIHFPSTNTDPLLSFPNYDWDHLRKCPSVPKQNAEKEQEKIRSETGEGDFL